MGKKVKPGRIKSLGDDIPQKIESFQGLYEKYNLPEHLQNAIKKCGYKSPTPVQSQIIPLLFDRREVICSAPTGSGKTLAFLIPIIHQLRQSKAIGSFRAVIITPTRELAKQIHREALWISQGYNLRIYHLRDTKGASVKFNPQSFHKFDILVTTPNRLSSMLSCDPPAIKLDKLEWLVLDECDRLFDLGFKNDLEIIYKSCQSSEKLRRAMFSATLDTQLVKWAQIQIDNVAIIEVGGKNRPTQTVDQELVYVGNEDGKLLCLRELIMSGINVPVIIFVETKQKAKSLADEFLYEDLNIDYINSDRDQEERDLVISSFREGKIWFLICTDLMGRGIDFKGVNVVINYDCPKTSVNYIHRIGRTGRAGRRGKAYTFVSNDDRKYLPQLIKVLRRINYVIPPAILSLTKKTSKKKFDHKTKKRL